MYARAKRAPDENKNERIRCPFVFGVFRYSVINTITIRRCSSGVRLSSHVCTLLVYSSSRTHRRICILHKSLLRMFSLFLFWFSPAEFGLVNRDGEVNRSIVHPSRKVSDDANTLTFDQIRKQFLAKTANTIEPQSRTVRLIDCNVKRHKFTAVGCNSANGIGTNVADDCNRFHKKKKM